jgi:3-deoxy-D-manno-octulosonic-acid transferase
MILFFYNLALLVALVVGAPWWLFRMATTQKYREGLLERLGRVRQLKGDGGRPLIWIHAVSVGEVLAVSRLVKTLDAALPEYIVAVSTTTYTGQALARERFGRNRVFYCPLDFPWAVRAYLNALKPKMLVLAETEFWPNMLSGCFRRGIPVAVVNARVSDRSWPRYLRLRRLWRPFLERLSAVLAQSETDADRLKAIGCQPERVSVVGNLKFDVRAAWEADATRILKQVSAGMRLIVAGSTLEGEEAALLAAWPLVLEADPQLVMVLAPRHPERFEAVAALLERSGASWVKRSDWRAQSADSIRTLHAGQIVLLDTIGELASVYSLAAVAFVGGSLIPAGGHNPLEPAQFGVPIVMGPNYANFRAITDDLIAHVAIRITAKEELSGVLIDLLRNRKDAEAMGERARHVFEQQAGATNRCVDALKTLLPPPVVKVRNLGVVDPAIMNEVRRLNEKSSDLEPILAYLRARGATQLESIAVLSSVLGTPLGEAKRAIHDSATWRDRNEAFDRKMDREIDELAAEMDRPDEPVRPKEG